MRIRIAIWAVLGGLVVGLWSVYLSTTHVQPRRLGALLLDITCPIALERNHPMTIYMVLFANIFTYALVGFIIENMRRSMKRPLNA